MGGLKSGKLGDWVHISKKVDCLVFGFVKKLVHFDKILWTRDVIISDILVGDLEPVYCKKRQKKSQPRFVE